MDKMYLMCVELSNTLSYLRLESFFENLQPLLELPFEFLGLAGVILQELMPLAK